MARGGAARKAFPRRAAAGTARARFRATKCPTSLVSREALTPQEVQGRGTYRALQETSQTRRRLGDVAFFHPVSLARWRRKRQPTPALLPGESHGQRSLAGYSPWGRK